MRPLYQQALELSEYGFSPSEIARILYNDSNRKLVNRVIRLLHYARSKQLEELSNCRMYELNKCMIKGEAPYVDPELEFHEATPEYHAFLGTWATKKKYVNMNATGFEKFIHDMLQFLKLLYDEASLGIIDRNYVLLSTAAKLFRSRLKHLYDKVKDFNIYIKNDYIRVDIPHFAYAFMALKFVALILKYNIDRFLERLLYKWIDYFKYKRLKGVKRKPEEALRQLREWFY